MDRGLASETPGSVHSAAFNHFNRTKPHMSTSNIIDPYNNNGQIDLRESNEEDLEDLGGDYNVNDNSFRLNKPTNQIRPGNNYSQQPQQTQQSQQPQQQPPNVPKINPNFLDRFPKDSANFSNRSNDSNNINNNKNTIYQSVNKKSTTMPNFNPNRNNSNADQIPRHNEATSFENLDDYYTVSSFILSFSSLVHHSLHSNRCKERNILNYMNYIDPIFKRLDLSFVIDFF